MYVKLIAVPDCRCPKCYHTGCFLALDERNNPAFYQCPSCGIKYLIDPADEATDGATAVASRPISPAPQAAVASPPMPFERKCCCEGEINQYGIQYVHRFYLGSRRIDHYHLYADGRIENHILGEKELCNECYRRLARIKSGQQNSHEARWPFSSYPIINAQVPVLFPDPFPAPLPPRPRALPPAATLASPAARSAISEEMCCCEGEFGQNGRRYRHSFIQAKSSPQVSHYHLHCDGRREECAKKLCNNCYVRMLKMQEGETALPPLKAPFSTYPTTSPAPLEPRHSPTNGSPHAATGGVRFPSPTNLGPPAQRRRSSREVCRTCGGIGCPDC